MTIMSTLQTDLVTAMKARNELAVTVLRGVIGAVNLAEKSGKTAVVYTDEQVLTLLAQQVKQRVESASIYAEKNVPDRAARETAEAEFLKQYLPTQLTEDEVKAIIETVVAELDVPFTQSQFGVVMKAVNAQTKGKADGKLVSILVRALIVE